MMELIPINLHFIKFSIDAEGFHNQTNDEL